VGLDIVLPHDRYMEFEVGLLAEKSKGADISVETA
jgi:hypothetical protein